VDRICADAAVAAAAIAAAAAVILCAHTFDSDQLGLPGGFPDFVGPEPTAGLRSATQIQSTCLSDANSLIGQLCPALRLCLAAEVATGLLCDRWGLSQKGLANGGLAMLQSDALVHIRHARGVDLLQTCST